MRGKVPKDWLPLVRTLHRKGFTIERRSGSKHWRVIAPDGHFVTTLPCSASDHRALRNARAAFKRMGVIV